MALYSVAPIFRRRFRRRIIRPGALICLPCPTPQTPFTAVLPLVAPAGRRLPAAAGRLGRRRAVVPVSRRRGGARRGRGGLGRAASLAAGPADRRPSLARRPPLVGGVGAGRRRAAGLVAHAAAVQRPRLGRRGEPHAAGTVQGDHVRLQDVRNFDWRGDADYDARWDTRDYDLSRLRSVDMILSTWGMPAIAHTLVSFGFDDGQRVVFSVEIRKERGEQFSELGGFFKQFELSVIAADERDIVRVRTAVRGETVSIYPIRMPPEAMRALFLSYVDTANALRAEPRFYHTVSANCTTIIYQMVRAIVPGLPVDYRLLLSGYLPEYLYEHGGLDTSRPLDAIRRDADITQRAARAGNTPAFSQAIREPFLSPDHEAFPRARRAAPRCC